jgi:ornithine--oxo-acid transaminase
VIGPDHAGIARADRRTRPSYSLPMTNAAACAAPMTAPKLDLEHLLRTNQAQTLNLHEQYVNPAFAAVLRTIGFDATFVRGQGAYLWDDRGRRYIDCLGGYAVFNCGRNHPVIRDAIQQAMNLDLPNLLGIGAFRLSGVLARELILTMPGSDGKTPGELDTVFFCSAGTEAVEAAIKHARAATGRDGIAFCTKAYHGLSMGALSVCGNHEFRDGFGKLLDSTVEIPFNDLAALEKALASKQVAAFIVEPIQGKGVNIPAENYLRDAAALCKKYGTLFILDEIQIGMGRSGKMWCCQHFGAGSDGGGGAWLPDMLILAKAISGGYIPSAAVVLKRSIHSKVFSSMNQCSRIQTTYSMNDLAMAAGLATLHVMKHEETVQHAGEIGEYLISGLRQMVGRYQMVKEVRGKGLMIAIEFQAPKSLGLRAGWELLHRMDQSLFCQAVIMPLFSDHGVIAQVAGHKQDVIKLIPPLVLTRQDCDDIIRAFDAAVGACHTFPGPAWEVGRKLGAAAVKRFAPGTPTVQTTAHEPVGSA